MFLCSLIVLHAASTGLQARSRAHGEAGYFYKKMEPLSKKIKGTGCVRGASSKWVKSDAEQRDPQLPTSVPMPSAVDNITDAGMRAMWEADGSQGAAPACDSWIHERC